jgi:hypothetical protein
MTRTQTRPLSRLRLPSVNVARLTCKVRKPVNGYWQPVRPWSEGVLTISRISYRPW